AHADVEFGLNDNPVHDEAVRRVEKVAPGAHRYSAGVLNESAKRDLFFKEFFPVIAEDSWPPRRGGQNQQHDTSGREEDLVAVLYHALLIELTTIFLRSVRGTCLEIAVFRFVGQP